MKVRKSLRDKRVIPVVEERLATSKRKVETGRVRVRKTVRSRIETVDLPVISEEFSVERVAVNSPVGEQPPTPRWEGDTMIVPVLEQRLVIERRWWVREELHLKRRRREIREPQNVELRSEQVHVERSSSPAEARRPLRAREGKSSLQAARKAANFRKTEEISR